MKTLLAILLGKTIFAISRLLNLGGGFAAPGLYALKLDPNLVTNLINHKAKNIVVTGTNGKTTTSKLISHFLKSSGEKVIRNSSGSNLERGIASYLISNASISGKLNYDFGVWELDEFAFNSVAPKIKPDIVILLNAFRDQLDRYGEVDTVINRWKQTLGKLKSDTVLIISGDDGNLEKAVKDFKGQIIRVGVKDSKITGESKTKTNNKLDYEAEILKSSNLNQTDARVSFNNSKVNYTIPLPGIFNTYNFLASLALIHNLNLDVVKMAENLKDFTPSFGRNEKFEMNGKQGSIFLIKNPVGATQVLETILPHIKPQEAIMFALNDNFADGTDVSWIWDINLENTRLSTLDSRLYISGSRAYDMALRLKYAGLNEKNFIINSNLESSFKNASKEKALFILPTYTALMELQRIMVKKGIKKEYWRDN